MIARLLLSAPPLRFELLYLIRRTFAVLPSLLDQQGREQLARIELGQREAVEPGFDARTSGSAAGPRLTFHSFTSTRSEPH